MSQSARLFSVAIASAIMAAVVAVVLMIAHPVSAQATRTAVCRQVNADIALDPVQLTRLMDSLLAQGKTSVVLFGTSVCAY
jgi:hypothetical protein